MKTRPSRESPREPAAREIGFRISDAEFASFRELIHKSIGITLSESKRQLLCSRLGRRLRHHGFTTFSQYYEYLRTRDGQGLELREMVNCITTNKTHFFREPHHFDFLRDQVFPEIAARKGPGEKHRLRVWSAGCSTGEEPYSIAITALEALERARWSVKILASDVDTDVLARAERGVYSSGSAADLPSALRQRWFPALAGDPDRMTARDELRELLIFRRINLIERRWPINTRFDVIFCRNVTIYFDRATQEQLYERFARLLNPGGYLIAGHSENLSWLNHLFEPLGKTIYQVKPSVAGAPLPLPSPSSAVRNTVARATSARQEANVVSGGVFASSSPAAVRTLLGSCVSVCLHDPEAGVGGMNHFMLPEGPRQRIESAAYGVHAMELLINRIMALGGQRSRLRARVFGAANVLRNGLTRVADENARFALEFLTKEGIPVIEKRLGGDQPLRVTFFTDTGDAQIRAVGGEIARVARAEERHAREIQRSLTAPAAGKAVLF
jgi:chemotaxis protein methyltransferase CheR